MVVNDSVTRPDGGFPTSEQALPETAGWIWCVRNGNSRAKILVVIGPERLLPIRLPTRSVCNDLLCGESLGHERGTRVHVLVEAGIGGDLIAVGFIRWLKDRVTKAGCDRKVRSQSPGILCVPIIFPGAELFVYQRTLGDRLRHAASLQSGGAVETAGDQRNESDQINDSVVVW